MDNFVNDLPHKTVYHKLQVRRFCSPFLRCTCEYQKRKGLINLTRKQSNVIFEPRGGRDVILKL